MKKQTNMLKQKDRKIINCKIIYSYSVKAHDSLKSWLESRET